MRAFQIALIIIMLQSSIAFTNELGIFDDNFITSPDNEYVSYTVEDVQELSGISEDPGLYDYSVAFVKWSFQALLIFLKIIGAIAFTYPLLVNALGMPEALSGFIQVGIYIIFAWNYAEWKRGISTKHMT